jgi:hypothetical protein
MGYPDSKDQPEYTGHTGQGDGHTVRSMGNRDFNFVDWYPFSLEVQKERLNLYSRIQVKRLYIFQKSFAFAMTF